MIPGLSRSTIQTVDENDAHGDGLWIATHALALATVAIDPLVDGDIVRERFPYWTGREGNPVEASF
jgi:hypothetical protein